METSIIIHKGKHYFKSIDGYREIVASTNTSLGLPGIDISFLEEYVSKEGKIKLVEIELGKELNPTKILGSTPSGVDYETLDDLREIYNNLPKLTSDNCVIIVEEEKKLYTKEDMKESFKVGYVKGFSNSDNRRSACGTGGYNLDKEVEEYFNKNIK